MIVRNLAIALLALILVAGCASLAWFYLVDWPALLH